MRAFLLLLLSACQTSLVPATPIPGEDPSQAYEALLQRIVTEDGYVRWERLRQDRQALDAYVAWLTRPGALPEDPAAAHAVWLNAYNAWVLYGVLETDVQDSVQELPGWVPEPGAGFFLERTYNLGGSHYSLYVAEHSYIRAGMKDWRDHAALNCASASCPPLRSELFVAERLDAQLDDQVRRWVDDPIRGFRKDGETLVFSPIFDWFEADFPVADGSLCTLLAPYAKAERRALLTASPDCPTVYFRYDWRLNRPEVAGQVPPRP